ncbi:MAG: CHAD domain-containing protein [Tolumonas sp.]|nr:CHAD domain-containing protein [Tolumonas sp.]
MSKTKKKEFVVSNRSFARELSTHFAVLASKASQALVRMNDDGDSEALHDLRVNLRSLRVLQGLYPRCHIMREQKKQLGIAAALTGQDRDREVRLALAESLHAETGCGAEIVSLLADNLLALRQHLLPDLHATALAETLSQVSSVWDRKTRHKRKSVLQSAARQKSRQLEKRFLKAAADLKLSSPIADWHSLRLQVKQLRYWGQGFVAVLTKRQNRRLPVLTELQQSLGLLHDIALFEEQWPQELILPKQWQKRLKKRQQRALKDASGVLRQLKKIW